MTNSRFTSHFSFSQCSNSYLPMFQLESGETESQLSEGAESHAVEQAQFVPDSPPPVPPKAKCKGQKRKAEDDGKKKDDVEMEVLQDMSSSMKYLKDVCKDDIDIFCRNVGRKLRLITDPMVLFLTQENIDQEIGNALRKQWQCANMSHTTINSPHHPQPAPSQFGYHTPSYTQEEGPQYTQLF